MIANKTSLNKMQASGCLLPRFSTQITRPSRTCILISRKAVPSRLIRRIRASNGNEDNGASKDLTPKEQGRYSKMVDELQKKGMTPAKAKEVLRVWAELGAKDPQQLKQLLMKRSMQPLSALVIQTVLDFVASGGGFYVGKISTEADFPGSILIGLLGYFFACYYLLQGVFQLTALANLLSAANRYSTDATVLLAAVRELAGPGSGLSVVDSANLVANTLKVIQMLETIGEQLKDITPGGEGPSSLANLSAYLTLQRAEEVYGFQPEKYGLSEAQAADIAGVFSQFDANEDGRLEQSELRVLCAQLGTEISQAEAKEAIRILDSSNTGYIQFADFVEWYMGTKPSREAKDAASTQSV